MITWENPSKVAVSRDSAANCRLLLLNERVLCDFSDEKTRKRFSAGENVEKLEAVALDQSDIVTVGKTGLRAHATTKTHEKALPADHPAGRAIFLLSEVLFHLVPKPLFPVFGLVLGLSALAKPAKLPQQLFLPGR